LPRCSRRSCAGPARAILEHARDLDATLIVLGSRGLGALGGLLLGSVAHKIVQLSSCPVLVVRDKHSLDERHHDVLRAQTRFQA
jgi:nucleotide-binding universal stress UspA family protein